MITLEIVATIRLNDHNDLTSVLLEMELVDSSKSTQMPCLNILKFIQNSYNWSNNWSNNYLLVSDFKNYFFVNSL